MRAVEKARAQGWRSGQDTMALVMSLWAEVHGWADLLIDGLLPEGFDPDPKTLEAATEALLE